MDVLPVYLGWVDRDTPGRCEAPHCQHHYHVRPTCSRESYSILMFRACIHACITPSLFKQALSSNAAREQAHHAVLL